MTTKASSVWFTPAEAASSVAANSALSLLATSEEHSGPARLDRFRRLVAPEGPLNLYRPDCDPVSHAAYAASMLVGLS